MYGNARLTAHGVANRRFKWWKGVLLHILRIYGL
jgi:hypothetical protein